MVCGPLGMFLLGCSFRSFAVSGLVFGFLCTLFVYLEACLRFLWVVGLGFLCMLEALCVLVFVYLEALYSFFWYNTLTYKKKKKNCFSFSTYDEGGVFINSGL